jgi:hypothetical protein
MNEQHLDPDLHLNQQEVPAWWYLMENNCKRVLKFYGVSSWAEVPRAIYKETSCGASISAKVAYQDDIVLGSDFHKLKNDSPILELNISSIIEGSEAETSVYTVNMTKRNVLKNLESAIKSVEEEADELWNAANE